MKRPRILLWSALTLVVAAVAGIFAAALSHRGPSSTDEIPLAEVKRGAIDLQVHAIGELQAGKSQMLTAPTVGGDSLQITHLVRSGEMVKRDDIVIAFDPSEQNYKLEQSRSELLQAEQEITKATADAAVLAAQDKVALLKARYDVRKAELDVQKNELLSKIDAEKNDLALRQAKRVLAEREQDIQSHAESGKAAIYLAQEKHTKAKLTMDQAQQNLEKMQVKAPMDGLVSIQKNVNAAGGFFFTGMSLPEYRQGDQAQAGSPIVQVVDTKELNLVSKVSEQDHNNVHPGQPVDVRFYALPGNTFRGTIKGVGGMTMRQFFESGNGGSFDVAIQLSHMDDRLRPGLTADILCLGQSSQNVLYIPRQAIFLKDGKRITYVASGTGYSQREVTIEGESESRAVIRGLEVGARVALIDPTVPRKSNSKSSAAGEP